MGRLASRLLEVVPHPVHDVVPPRLRDGAHERVVCIRCATLGVTAERPGELSRGAIAVSSLGGSLVAVLQ